MYAELHCHSWFSLLDGAESPAALVARASALGLTALALTDHDSLAGAIQFTRAAKQAGLHAIVGAELTLDDGPCPSATARQAHLTVLAENPRGYANLCRILTRAHTGPAPADPADWPGKTPPAVPFDFVAAHGEGLIVLSGCRRGAVAAANLCRDLDAARARAAQLREAFGTKQVWIELQHHRLPDDDRLVRGLVATARALDLPLVATQNAHYADAGAARLRDALIAIDHNIPLTEARRAGLLPFNHTYALCGADAMQRRFREVPDAVANSLAIAERCHVTLDFADRRTPAFPAPDGQSEFAYLYALCHAGLPRRYPQLKPAVLNQLAHELAVIEQAGLAGYFLVVWDIVRFAREQGVRCQGRGSAANSLVAYLLGITAVDPLAHDLLFERFLSADRYTIPDIDLDFAADRREEVIRYVYDRYGAARTAMVCNFVTYQARSAVRDLAKALDFPAPVIERLAKELDTHSCTRAADALAAQATAPADGAESPSSVVTRAEHPLLLLADLVRCIDDCPRHLSIHVGGMLITAQSLDEVVPLERATMPGRVVCQWNKDSVEDAGLIKIDLLALRTLGLISEALGNLPAPPDLDALALDDPRIYAMLQRGDTLGTFQVESRAQQQMLPRLKPERFADIVVEVAIVRPGPIQGGAVHPYLRRRSGLEPVAYLHPSLEPVLRETLGVLLFQEQAIRVAMAAARFGPGEADLLRRSLSRSDTTAIEGPWRERFVKGAAANGIDRATADAIFDQLAGFAGYGFCKSHAASFALIAYQTMHLKAYHPAAFYCALLNQQPMGFYQPEVIIGDARRHGVVLLPPDINRSDWRYTVEGERRLRAGLQAVSELGATAWTRIAEARASGPFADLRDLRARTRLSREVIANLIRAGACDTLGDRRALLWTLGGIDIRPDELPLDAPPADADLPVLTDTERTAWEYELMGLSAHGQALRHLREAFNRAGLASTAEVKALPNGRIIRTAGMVVVRQRPQTAKGMVFMSLEDEFGLLDVVFRPDVYERCRKSIRRQTVILVDGELQKASGAISVLAHRARGWES